MNNLRWQEVEAFVPVRYELGVFLVLIFKWRVVMLSDGASGSGTSRFLHLVQQVYSNRTLKCLRIISTSACGRVGFHSVSHKETQTLIRWYPGLWTHLMCLGLSNSLFYYSCNLVAHSCYIPGKLDLNRKTASTCATFFFSSACIY